MTSRRPAIRSSDYVHQTGDGVLRGQSRSFVTSVQRSSLTNTLEDRLSSSMSQQHEAVLQAVIPSAIDTASRLRDPNADQLPMFYPTWLMRKLLFAVANNFAGLADVPKAGVVGFLRNGSKQILHSLIQSAPDLFAARAIAHSLFAAAIESENAEVVRYLLSNDTLALDVNGFIHTGKDDMQTPIERSSTLQSKEVVQVLLQHNADANLTYGLDSKSKLGLGGAMDALVETACYSDRRPTEHADIDLDLFRMLLQAGGRLSEGRENAPAGGALSRLCQLKRYSNLLILYIEKYIASSYVKWLRTHTIRDAILYQDSETAEHIISKLLSVYRGSLLETQYPVVGCPRVLVEIAARKGHENVVMQLLDAGVDLTETILIFGAESGNYSLVTRLLSKGAKMDTIWKDHTSPPRTALSAAIRLDEDNNKVLELLLDQGASCLLADPTQLSAALAAAATVGNMRLAMFLLDNAPQVRSEDLTLALTEAIEAGQQEIVAHLLERGASLHGNAMMTPLHAALKARNTSVMQTMLHGAGIKPNYCDRFGQIGLDKAGPPIVVQAVEWGDKFILQELVNAGADVDVALSHRASAFEVPDTPLWIAVRNRAFDMMEILLDGGADPNFWYSRSTGRTPLAAAASNADVVMAQHLLDKGASPQDPWALAEAVENSPELSKALIRRLKLAYRSALPQIGSLALIRTIRLNDYSTFSSLLDQGFSGARMHRFGEFEKRYGANEIKLSLRITNPCWHAIQKAAEGDFRFIERLFQDEVSPDLKIVLQYGIYDEQVESESQITAFLAAIRTRSAPLVELFLKHGANVNFPTIYGIRRTPLQEACNNGSVDIVERLIEACADINAPAAYAHGATALQAATTHGYVRIMEILLDRGVEVDAPGSKVCGKTALETASESGRLDAVSMLLQAGAGRGGEDKLQFERAMSLAKRNGFAYICDMMKDYLETPVPRQVNCRPTYTEWVDWEFEEENR